MTSAIAESDRIELAWTVSPTAAAYEVYRNGVAHGFISYDQPYLKDFEVEAGEDYSYEVRAVARDGTASTGCESVEVTMGLGSLTLAWDPLPPAVDRLDLLGCTDDDFDPVLGVCPEPLFPLTSSSGLPGSAVGYTLHSGGAWQLGQHWYIVPLRQRCMNPPSPPSTLLSTP